MNKTSRKTFDREMIARMINSSVFRNAISQNISRSGILEKALEGWSLEDWSDITDACIITFKTAAPTIATGMIPDELEGSFNNDPLPRVIGCDGVYVVWDISGYGLHDQWFESAEEAIAEAESNWLDLTFSFTSSARTNSSKTSTDNLKDRFDANSELKRESAEHYEKIIEDQNLVHLVKAAIDLYEDVDPAKNYKSHPAGMAHLHKRNLYRIRVIRYVATNKHLPNAQELRKWIKGV